MSRPPALLRSALSACAAVAAAVMAWAPQAEAKITKIIIDRVAPVQGDSTYEMRIGRAFGELDPNDPHNVLITDIGLAAKNANNKVEYIASFVVVTPIDMSKSSGLMWHDVPNRGGRIIISS